MGKTDVRRTPRQTDRNPNQSISLSLSKVYFKFTRSQGRLQPAAHFVRELHWPLSHCRGLSWCKSGGGTNSSSHNSIRHLHIEHLHPRKSANTTPPPLPPHILSPPTGVAPCDPRGSLCPCSPPVSPGSPSCPLLTLSGPATIPDPAPETGRLEFKVNVPFSASVCGLPCPAPVRPLSDNYMHRSFFRTFSHTHSFFFLSQPFLEETWLWLENEGFPFSAAFPS